MHLAKIYRRKIIRGLIQPPRLDLVERTHLGGQVFASRLLFSATLPPKTLYTDARLQNGSKDLSKMAVHSRDGLTKTKVNSLSLAKLTGQSNIRSKDPRLEFKGAGSRNRENKCFVRDSLRV